MADYIDRQALDVVAFTDRDGTFSDGIQWLLEYIDALPTADVQPVVRCMDCRWYKTNFMWNGKEVKICAKEAYEPRRNADDYCSYGERK